MHTFGALDPVQVIQQARSGIQCVYVSGWQCSSTASTTNEPGPDFADYPANTVPNKVDQLFRAQLFHDRKQREERSKMTAEERKANAPVDFLRPIIADGDCGFGGMTSVMKLIKLQIEAGAAGVHIEDQSPGTKKCGHMVGKCLVPVREQFDRLSAARLQADVMGAPTVLISRTDAGSATYLTNNIDPRDHPYIAGSTNPDIGSLEDATEKLRWLDNAHLMRYSDAVAAAMQAANEPVHKIKSWMTESMKMANGDARALASRMGYGNVFWDWDAPRAREGYFRVIGGVDYCAMRAIAFSPIADLIWMETATPNIPECAEFSKLVHAAKPHQMLAYNLSPSFRDAAGMNDDAIQNFQTELGRLGFTWHFITLAGFHTNALAITEFSRAYAGPKGVLAYVQMIQRQERDKNVSTLTHQKWSGAEFCDSWLQIATAGGASTSASHGSTEDQFKSKL